MEKAGERAVHYVELAFKLKEVEDRQRRRAFGGRVHGGMSQLELDLQRGWRLDHGGPLILL